MADEEKSQQVIIVKKKGGHGGHHGGAWKVAYADFVTAMMAFFLVLWLVGQTDEVRQAVQGYFQDPTGFMQKGKGDGILKGGASPISLIGKDKLQARLERERQMMLNVAKRIRQAIENIPELRGLKDFIEIEITPEGLRIQLIEGGDEAKSNFFAIGSAELKPRTAMLLASIAKELGQLPNYIIIEGHTDSKPYSGKEDYTNWELSADRANSARKLMEEMGLHYGQVVEIRGLADRMPRLPDNPADPRNRRVAIILLNDEAGQKYSGA